MTTDVAGALLRSQIIAGNVTAFIGSKTGFYSDDIGFLPKDIVMPISSSISSVVSQNAGEFDIPLGAWVHNYGQDPQTGVRLSANIKKGLSTLYTQTSSPVTIAPGDSAFIQLPTFSQSSYALGYYDLNYSVSSDSTDDFMADNKKTSDFVMSDTLFAAGLLDSVTYFPQTQAGYQPANMSGEFQACLHFKDSLAGRLAVDGMYFTATANTGDTLLGLEIETVVYRWDNEFTDLNDPNFAFDNMIDLSYGSYVFAGPEDGQRVFASFTPPVILENNKRYLFCVKYDDPVAFIGYSTQSDYETTVDYHLQPISPTSSDGTWYALGFGTDLVPSISVRMFDKNLLGVEEEPITQIVPYPNPASEVLNIPIKDISGKIRVDVMDLSGKIVSTTQANMDTPGNLAVNVDGLSSGQYMFRMITEDNTIRTFKVVITK
jgi:hypothetical protein